jgi:hypothetical protein
MAANKFFDTGMVPDTSMSGSAAGSSSSSSSSSSAAGGGAKKRRGSKALETEFARFADPADPTVMGEDSIVAFATELGIDAFSDPVILVFARATGQRRQGPFSFNEFTTGMGAFGASTVAQLKAKVETMRGQLSKPTYFPGFWAWAYEYSCEEGQRSLSLEVVIALTSLLLSPEMWPLVGDWVEWLGKQTKTVTRDTWVQLLDLSARVKSSSPADLAVYDESSAWPSMFDDFIDWLKRGKKEKSKGGR